MNARLKTFTADNYIMVPGFAIVELGLSANELLCYSLIYGFTQDGESEFFGSLTYIASALNVTKQNAKNIIDRLLKRGLLEKKEIYFSGVKFCHYVAKRNSNGVAETITPVAETATPVIETATGGVAETATYNTIKDNKDIINHNDNSASCGCTGLFPGYEAERIENSINAETEKKEKSCAKKERKGTSENLCLFANSRYAEYEAFKACFDKPEYADIDICYYYNAVADWSAQRAKKKNDWIATARNFMRSDANAGKLHKLPNRGMETDKEYTDRMMDECMRRTLEGWM